MKLQKTNIKNLVIIELERHVDSRGWFIESHNKFSLEKLGIFVDFVQDNHSYSAQKGTLRGLHLQKAPYEQNKLVRCTRGRILDIAVDLRKNSETYKTWFSLELTDSNNKSLFIPHGFAHGFITLTDNCEIQYKVDKPYNKDSEITVIFNDEQINVDWGFTPKHISEKDLSGKTLKELENYL